MRRWHLVRRLVLSNSTDCVATLVGREPGSVFQQPASISSGQPYGPTMSPQVGASTETASASNAKPSATERFRAWLSKPEGLSSRLGLQTSLGQQIASRIEQVVGVVAPDTTGAVGWRSESLYHFYLIMTLSSLCYIDIVRPTTRRTIPASLCMHSY